MYSIDTKFPRPSDLPRIRVRAESELEAVRIYATFLAKAILETSDDPWSNFVEGGLSNDTRLSPDSFYSFLELKMYVREVTNADIVLESPESANLDRGRFPG